MRSCYHFLAFITICHPYLPQSGIITFIRSLFFSSEVIIPLPYCEATPTAQQPIPTPCATEAGEWWTSLAVDVAHVSKWPQRWNGKRVVCSGAVTVEADPGSPTGFDRRRWKRAVV